MYIDSNQQLSSLTEGSLNMKEIIPGTKNLAGYLEQENLAIIEENLWLPLYETSIISTYTLNMDPYAHR